jgi:hypothetical protein
MATPRTGNPRGRPRGAKNKPKTVEAFVIEALTAPQVSPPRKPKLKARGPWAGKTPEERRALSAKLNAGRDLTKIGGGRKAGVPLSRTNKQHAQVVAEAQPEITRIMNKMAEQGILPDDPRAVEALEEAVKVLRVVESAKDKLAAARLILDFTKSKPTAKIEHTVRSAEDILDEMADD